ncbi:MAG TPA: hypothetical protein VGP43_03155, partial [Chitinophagaceae bacterium]|nr:hypothetical protein [Chitinophagaceae bacterium]
MKHHNKLWLPLLCFIALTANSQLVPITLDCPPNIGFESGSFNNWNCFSGAIQRDGTLNLSPGSPVADRHTIIANSFPQSLDPYGGFPVNCPNGSGYSVRLGNSSAGGQAERISYTFTIPANQSDYSILYNYAVVFQNPTHRSYEQPRFTSKVYNVTDNKYINCGSFEFVASSNLPGFKLSNSGGNVFYKPWSPVTVNLSGLAGKTVRLEFSTNDCAFTQHFGYAYLDVNEDCSSGPISGNTYCAGAESLVLTAPYGFASYSWYTADFSQLLGNENILNVKPVPAANTTYSVVIIPYDGLGCLDTLYTTIHASNEPFKLNVLNEITGCSSGVDLTSPTITAGSTPGLNYTYFTDLNQTGYVSVPSKVTTSGIYYIKGVNKTGCNDIKPINVIISEPPNLMVNNPAGVCIPQKIDITNPSITSGSEQGLKISYWKNFSGTIPLLNPTAIDVSGIYYIKAEKNGFCDILKPVEVKIGPVPTFIIRNASACGKTDITEEAITAGSSPNLAYTYWMDTVSTIPLPNPQNITASGTYYIKAASILGCSVIKPI